jgi:hypothetical protein
VSALACRCAAVERDVAGEENPVLVQIHQHIADLRVGCRGRPDRLRVGLWLAPAAPADTVKATTATGIYLVIRMKLPLFLARF